MTHYVWIASQIRATIGTALGWSYWPMAEYVAKISPWGKGGVPLDRAHFALWTDWRTK